MLTASLHSVHENEHQILFEHLDRLPRTVRAFLSPLGGTEARGAAFASYLLFEPEFTQALLALGERDAIAQADEIAAFLYGVVPEITQAPKELSEVSQ